MKKNFLSCLLLLLFVSGCQAVPTTNPPPVIAYRPVNTLYVTTNGVDVVAARGRIDAPFATIGAAISSAQPGDKILVGPGTFTDSSSATLPDRVKLQGAGTNLTTSGISALTYGHSNEISGLSFTNRGGAIGVGMVKAASESGQLYMHDCSILGGPECAVFASFSGGGVLGGWNVISNCLFDAQAWGVECAGTNFFYNCHIQKNTDRAAVAASGTKLLANYSGLNAHIYWSGGSITSLTNSLYSSNDPTNNWGVWNLSGDTYLQNATISTPTGGEEIFGTAGNTNYISSLTWTSTKTNLSAVVKSFSGFSSTNHQASAFVPVWFVANTNTPFLLNIP